MVDHGPDEVEDEPALAAHGLFRELLLSIEQLDDLEGDSDRLVEVKLGIDDAIGGRKFASSRSALDVSLDSEGGGVSGGFDDNRISGAILAFLGRVRALRCRIAEQKHQLREVKPRAAHDRTWEEGGVISISLL